MIPTRLNIIIPSVGLLDDKARKNAQYLLRNLDTDLTDLYQATLKLWCAFSEEDPINLHVLVEQCFEDALNSLDLDFTVQTKVVNVIERTLARINQSLGVLLLPFILTLFEHRQVQLRLKETTDVGDLVIEISEVTQTDEIPTPSLPAYPAHG
jgi:hypothetical protein